ncbi:MAG: glycosyltransferase [Thermoanaerobaculia bacterium]
MDSVALSVVVPVFQGEAFLRPLSLALFEARRRLESEGAPVRLAEIIFVDDSSLDGSSEVLSELEAADPSVRVIRLSRNFGQHPATIAGILHSSGDWIATLDEDLQHDPKHLIPLLKRAVLNGRDVVYAKPVGPVHRSVLRDMGSSGFKAVMSRLAGNRFIQDFNSFRMLRGAVARAAAAVCATDPYLDIALCWFTDRVGSLPMEMADERSRGGGGSGYTVRGLLRHAGRMLGSSELKFLRLGAAAGILALTISVAISAAAVVIRLFYPQPTHPRGWASLILAISFFGGLISLLTGILLEQSTAILIRAKGKPTFFVVDRSRDAEILDWARREGP